MEGKVKELNERIKEIDKEVAELFVRQNHQKNSD